MLDGPAEDTKLWQIDHENLTTEYIAAMAAIPFLLGALDMDSPSTAEQKQSILVVGMGGGGLDMFWHTKCPWVGDW